jgi:hypothetical protein
MKTERPIEGIFILKNGDVFADGWVPAIIKKDDFGGLEMVPANELAFPHLGTNGGNKRYVFSPTNLVYLSNPPSDDELARAEILPSLSVH